jgi:hypothetical protein
MPRCSLAFGAKELYFMRTCSSGIAFAQTIRKVAMPDQPNTPVIKPFWRRGLAGLLDFLTVFFVGGYIIAEFTGETTTQGFNLTGVPALVLFVIIILYFYLGWKKLGGTIWQRIFGAR